MGASNELSSQWRNPKDILSLLLLIGGDIIQKAIAQLFGVYVELAKDGPRIYLTPVAFSFGWVGYAFTSLTSVIGDKQLMPSDAESHAIVINCDNGYTRINRSWLLGRIIRDRELVVEAEWKKLKKLENKKAAGPAEGVSTSPAPTPAAPTPPIKTPPVSLRIDIFELQGETRPNIDRVWVFSWLMIAVQLGISIIPWVLYSDWAILLVTAAGTLFALLTGSLRQWKGEKWPGQPLNPAENKNGRLETSPPLAAAEPVSPSPSDIEKGKAASEVSPATSPSQRPEAEPQPKSAKEKPKTKTVCLTRGNGHRYAMILRCSKSAWDLEALATATSDSLPETPWCLVGLAVLWICLLISVSGLESNTWFLLLIGGLGMLQNVYVASARREPEDLGLRMKPFKKRPKIIGSKVKEEMFWPKLDAAELSDDDKRPAGAKEMAADDPLVREEPYLEPWETVGVRGAIRELEKTIPKAGMALMPEFFPAVWRVERERYRDKRGGEVLAVDV